MEWVRCVCMVCMYFASGECSVCQLPDTVASVFSVEIILCIGETGRSKQACVHRRYGIC